ncbi:MAG TPA: ribosome assembly cofactor RimP [Flavitalea sp.]|nr:ribosome assembly cofactor RimP [Flavitalea sp.]
MSIETQLQTIENMIGALLAEHPGYFLVEVKIKPTNNVKVYLDGDAGISIEKCIMFNRALYKQFEETVLFPADDFSLEVSSPGLDEPLKLFRQYKKNIGREVEVTLKDGARIEGKLKEAAEEEILVEETTGKAFKGRPASKKQEIINHNISFENIKSTKIQIVF